MNARDEALRSQFLALTLSDVRHELETAANGYHIEPRVAESVLKEYDDRAKTAAAENNKLEELRDWDRVRIGLIALSDRERELVLQHFHEKTISGRAVQRFLTLAGSGRRPHAQRRPLRL